MAWRNLWRNKRRTLITGFSVAFGVLLSVTFTASADYSYMQMIDSSAQTGLGHVTVEPAGYNISPSLRKWVSGTEKIREAALGIPGVKSAIIRIEGQAMFASAVKSVGGMFMAINPARESAANNLFIRSMVEGSLFDNTDGRGIVIGVKMAEKLNLRIGKKIVYTATDKNGEIVSEVARVTGMFRTGVNELDGGAALLPIDRVRSMLRYGKGDATMVAVIIDDQRDADRVRNQLKNTIKIGGREILTWKETQADLSGLIAVDKSTNYLFQFLVGMMIAAGILNTIMMAVLERKHEFGVMLAVGMAPYRLFLLMLAESVWLGLFGVMLGVVITAPWYAYVSTIGIDLSPLMGGEQMDFAGVLMDPVMKFKLYKETVIAILSGVFFLTLVAGLYPAWKAGRMPPVESLKTI